MILSKELKASLPGLIRVIEKHLPQSIEEMSIGDPKSKVSRFYADTLLRAIRSPEEHFGFVGKNQMDSLARVARAAVDLERSLSMLPEREVERLRDLVSIQEHVEHPVVQEAYFLAGVVATAVKKRQGELKSIPEAKKNRDWKMAALAGVCREIWAREEWRIQPERYGPAPIQNALNLSYGSEGNISTLGRYRHHLQNFAPKSEKLDAPGPMGRFIEDILRIVGGYEEGAVPSAQSALRSWKHAVDNSPSQRK